VILPVLTGLVFYGSAGVVSCPVNNGHSLHKNAIGNIIRYRILAFLVFDLQIHNSNARQNITYSGGRNISINNAFMN